MSQDNRTRKIDIAIINTKADIKRAELEIELAIKKNEVLKNTLRMLEELEKNTNLI